MVQWPCKFNGLVGSVFQMIFYVLSQAITWTFAVESTPVIAYYAYIYDSSWKAKWLIMNYVVLNLLTQLPKRIFWRNRPWRISVGKVFKRDLTSSFPSRTANLAAVFAFTIFVSDLNNIDWNWLLKLSFVCSYLATISRIYIGAHFFSDCVVGVMFAWTLNVLNLVSWWSLAAVNAEGWLDFVWANWGVSRYVIMLLITLFQIWMNKPEVNFWDKGNAIFGCIWGILIGIWDLEAKLGKDGKFARSDWWTRSDLAAVLAMYAYITVVNNMVQPMLEKKYPKYVQTVRICFFFAAFKLCQYLVMML